MPLSRIPLQPAPALLHPCRFGHPVPTEVSLLPVPGKAILVTGHDMHDLHLL